MNSVYLKILNLSRDCRFQRSKLTLKEDRECSLRGAIQGSLRGAIQVTGYRNKDSSFCSLRITFEDAVVPVFYPWKGEKDYFPTVKEITKMIQDGIHVPRQVIQRSRWRHVKCLQVKDLNRRCRIQQIHHWIL